MPPGCFFVVGIGSKWRYDAIFSLHNFCWAGNGYFTIRCIFSAPGGHYFKFFSLVIFWADKRPRGR